MYFPENMEQLEQIKTECIQMVNKRALLSGAAAAVPLPGVDLSADITIMGMLKQYSIKYQLRRQ